MSTGDDICKVSEKCLNFRSKTSENFPVKFRLNYALISLRQNFFKKFYPVTPGAIAVNCRLLSIDGFACTDITPDTILHESTTKTVLINKLNQAFTTADLDAPLRSSLFLRLFDSLSVVKVGALTSVIYCRIFERLRG